MRSFDENWRNTSHICTRWVDSTPHPPMCFMVNGRSLAGPAQEFEKPQENSKINVTLESTKLGTPWKFYAWTRHYIRRLKLEFDSVAKICTAWTVKFVVNLLWSTTSNLFKWPKSNLPYTRHHDYKPLLNTNHTYKRAKFKENKSRFWTSKRGGEIY